MGKERLVDLIYQKAVLPLTSGSPEAAHDAVFTVIKYLERSDLFLEALRREFGVESARPLAVEALGIEFPSPFLLAGGLVKYGPGACTIGAMGAGGIEAGTFTWQRRVGNPRVREETIFDGRKIRVRRIERFSDGTIINWMGLPNPGTTKGVENLRQTRERIGVPLGVNVGVSPGLTDFCAKMQDLGQSLEAVYSLGPDWITFNASCPNVERGSSREEMMADTHRLMQGFDQIVAGIEKRTKRVIPALVKIGPDMSEDEIRFFVDWTKQCAFAGIIASNTTVDRTGSREKYAYIAKGGLSGPLLFEKSLETVKLARNFDRELGGSPLVIVGCGGVDSIEKWQKMKAAGADLCQVMTGFIFGGPYFFKKMNRDLGRG